MDSFLPNALIAALARAAGIGWRAKQTFYLQTAMWLGAVSLFQFPGKKGDVYNILWALVFGFATLNILSLAARHFESDRTRLSFGELLAILVVGVSIFLLGWEMLVLFKVFPIKLKPR